MPPERPGVQTFKGDPLTLIGNEIKVGDKAPDFALVGNDLSEVTLADSAGKIRIVSVVPSQVSQGSCGTARPFG